MRVLSLVVALAFLVPCVAVGDDDPYRVSKRDFRKTYRTIAISPADADTFLTLTDATRAMLEEEIVARFKKRGYTVVPSDVLASLRAEMAALAGPVVDAATGETNLAKQQAIREHAYRELWFRHDIDAVVTIRIAVYNVPMQNDVVEWDNVKQRIAYEGRGKKYSANINVSSVLLTIYDATGEPLYVHYGGLEPIMRRQGEQLNPIAPEELLLDEKKIRKAAQLAVKPI